MEVFQFSSLKFIYFTVIRYKLVMSSITWDTREN